MVSSGNPERCGGRRIDCCHMCIDTKRFASHHTGTYARRHDRNDGSDIHVGDGICVGVRDCHVGRNRCCIDNGTDHPAGRYDINTVTRQELLCIEGVDGEMADSILKLREQVRGIEHLYELLYIDGMTNALFHRLEEHLYVDPATSDLRHP